MGKIETQIKKVLIVVPPLVNMDNDDPDPNRLDIKSHRLVSPVEPLVVASDLLSRGFEVELFDLGVHVKNRRENLRRKIECTRPDAVALVQSILTYVSATDWDGAAVFDIAREICPQSVTVLTGNTATNYPSRAVEAEICDYAIKGEVDFAIGDLLECLNAGEDIMALPGIVHRGKDGQVHVSDIYPEVDTAKLPMPAYYILDEEHRRGYTELPEIGKDRYPEHSRNYRDIVVSRSCTLRCSFCSVAHLRGPRQKYRRKPLEMVVREIEQALDQGVEEIHFFDELFADTENELIEFAEALVKRNLKFPWFQAQGMPLWPVTRNALAALVETGMYRLIAPYESGNDRALRECAGKINSTVEHHHNVTLWARELDLEIIGLFVIGMSGETRKEILDTLLFAENHPEIDHSVFSIAAPLVGTRLQKRVLKEGQLDDEDKVNRVFKRTVSLYRTDSFREYEMGVIRAFDWARINFSTPERKAKYARMVGLTLAELNMLITHSKGAFERFYPGYDGPKSFKELFNQPDLYEDAEPVIPGSMHG
jgi:radical SAM superfamily enzyme YgiQ (UPF0313 family)